MSIRDEVRASAAAHGDLGPGYDTAVAEGLVERIGEEIDRRVDARMFGHLQAPAPSRPRRVREPGRPGVAAVFLALGSMATGHRGHGRRAAPGLRPRPGREGAQSVLIALIWIVIGLVNIAYTRRN